MSTDYNLSYAQRQQNLALRWRRLAMISVPVTAVATAAAIIGWSLAIARSCIPR